MAIGTNHAKILAGLKDGKLQNKLAESKAKKVDKHGAGSARHCRNGSQLQKGPEVTPYHLLKLTIHQLIAIAILIIVSITGPTSYLQKRHRKPT